MQVIVCAATNQHARRVVTALEQRGVILQHLDSLDGISSLPLVLKIDDGKLSGKDGIALLHMGLMLPGAPMDVSDLIAVRDQVYAAGIGRLLFVLPAGPAGLGPDGVIDAFDTLRQDDFHADILLLPEQAGLPFCSADNPANVCTDAALFAAIEHSLSSDTVEKFHIFSDPTTSKAGYGLCKRLFDIGLSLGIVAALWWLLLIIWALVRFQSQGPGIFTQQRVGREERTFTCYKFRTMHLATPNLGTHEVPPDSVTALGRLLRASKIDELPQLVNVLKGEMSFVGPRPCLPTQLDLIERRRTRGIFKIVPGITGLAQVAKVDMSDPDRLVDWDYRYLQLRSFAMDLSILWQTALGKGGGDRTKARRS